MSLPSHAGPPDALVRLEEEADRTLAHRTAIGPPVYAAVVVLFDAFSGLWTRTRPVTLVLTGAVVATCVWRWLANGSPPSPSSSPRWRRMFAASSLAMAGAFALYVAVSMRVLGLSEPIALLLTSVAVFVFGSVYSMAPRLGLARRVTFALLLPPLAAVLGSDSSGRVLLALMFVLYLAYAIVLAKRLHDEYWRAALSKAELAQALARLGALQSKMLEQEKLAGLGVLAAGIAHEINNPMAYVTANIETLLEDLRKAPLTAEGRREYTDDILPATIDGIARVNTIVADLRRFGRGDPEGSIAYDLNREAATAVRMAQVPSKFGCRVDLDLGDVPQLLGRPQQIVQLLVNLIVNAAQAAGPNGTVTVRTWVAVDEVRVTVRDDGMGMTSDTRARLFEPFFTTKAVGEGTGLGLAIAHGIVKGHGGDIEVESRPGIGSAFTVRLPRRPSSESVRLGLHPRAET